MLPWERIGTFFADELPRLAVQTPLGRSEGLARLRAVEDALAPILEGPGERTRGAALVTVAQRAAGVLLPGAGRFMLRIAARTLVLNAGGGGDAALPLLGHPFRPDEAEPLQPLGQHAYALSFVGKVHTRLRAQVVEEAYRELGAGAFVATYVEPPQGKSLHAHEAGEREHTPQERHWLAIARSSAMQLAPRGVNPTSFRLYEALHLGLIPVYVYADVDEQPWLPYHDFSAGGLRTDGSLGRVSAAPAAGGLLWHRTSIVLRQSELRTFLTEALPVLVRNATWLAGKRAFVRAARDAYFSYEAATRQIYWFFRDPDSADIKCAQPPRSFYGGVANLGESWMQGVDQNTPA